jgi:hypothetical protein
MRGALAICLTIESGNSIAASPNPTQSSANSIDGSSDLGEPVRNFKIGVTNPVQSVADPLGGVEQLHR